MWRHIMCDNLAYLALACLMKLLPSVLEDGVSDASCIRRGLIFVFFASA